MITGKELRAIHIKMERAVEAEDYTTAEEMALILAPFVERQCEALDRDPAALIPAWETDR